MPGPAVLLVVGVSMRQGYRVGFMATLGILSTNEIFFTLSALGIGALIVASGTRFAIVIWIGAAYLIYLGVRMIMPLVKHLWQKRSFGEGLDLSEAKAAAPRVPQTAVNSFWQGFALQASNPKNILFFVAILPQFISTEGSVVTQLVILGVVSVLLELPILVFYGFASALSARLMKERVIEWIEAVGGGILIALGGALAASQHRSG